jgi:hypothetical protein
MRSFVFAGFFLPALLLFSIAAAAQGPMVYINGDQGIAGGGSGFALGRVAVGGSSAGKRDETSEMAHVLLKSCPEVSLTIDDSASHPDYLLLLNRPSGSLSQVMVLRPNKAVIYASKQTTVDHATKDGCKAIMADWRDRRLHTSQTIDPQGNWTAAKP